MKRNNKDLYEEIMKNVSKGVKNILNENNVDLKKLQKISPGLTQEVEDFLYGYAESSDMSYQEVKLTIWKYVDEALDDMGYSKARALAFKEMLTLYLKDEKTFDDLIERGPTSSVMNKQKKVKDLLGQLLDLDIKVKIDGELGGNWYNMNLDKNGNIILKLNKHNLDA